MEPCYQNSRLHPRTGGERWRRRERAQRGHRATAIARERFSSMRGTRIEVDFRTCSVSRDDLWPVDSSCARSPVLCERFKWEINIKRPFTTPSNKQLDSSFWWARFHPDFRRGRPTVRRHLEKCVLLEFFGHVFVDIFSFRINYGNGLIIIVKKKLWFKIWIVSKLFCWSK